MVLQSKSTDEFEAMKTAKTCIACAEMGTNAR
jgi:hypothetical protein